MFSSRATGFRTLHVALAALIITAGLPGDSHAADHAARNDATAATRSANARLLDTLPFSDRTDFENAHRGLLAPLPDTPVKGEQGNVVWDPAKYSFIKEADAAPPTVNPSLWRQAKLINVSGLFEVSDGIYQVRNLDLSNMTIIEGAQGITVVDPLISAETAKVALDLYYTKRGKKPVKAVIYTHSHVDHYGGVKGIINEADVTTGRVQVFAPEGFLEAAVNENVMAGNAMSRRASYMYGNLLPADARGQVGAGLGTTTSAGTVTLIPPTISVQKTGEVHVIDGLTYEFLMAPGSEAPAEMLWYIKEKKAISAAEDCTHTLHNTYSLRGAKIREPLPWSKYLNQALTMWGADAQVIFAQHHWPTWGNQQVNRLLRSQRDLYRYINDETLRLVNHGYTRDEVADQFKLPEILANVWANRGYYGSISHNVKATYVLYLGWFDGNPATLDELPPAQAGRKYVEFMGGADAVLQKAKASYEKGEYRWVAQVLRNVVFSDPANQSAKNLLADALEQLGYQAESGPWRNFYLSGAQELRNGVAQLPTPNTASPDTVRSMSLEMFFDYMAVRLNGPKSGNAGGVFNVDFGDTGGTYLLEWENGVLNHTANARSPDADATVTLSRETLNDIILKQTTVADAAASGKLSISGNRSKVDALLGNLDTFEFWFNLVTP